MSGLPSGRVDAKVLGRSAPRVTLAPPQLRFGFEPAWSPSDRILENENISANLLQVPRAAQRELEKAVAAGQRGDWSKAESHLYRSLKHYPQFSAAHYNLGVVALRKGSSAEGEALIVRSLELDHHNLYSLFALALLRLEAGDFLTSLRYAERFSALAPSEPMGLVILGVVQAYNHRIEDALRSLQRVETREHQKVAGYHLLAGSLHEMRGELRAALVEYQKYLRESPKAPNVAAVAAAVAELQTTLARK